MSEDNTVQSGHVALARRILKHTCDTAVALQAFVPTVLVNTEAGMRIFLLDAHPAWRNGAGHHEVAAELRQRAKREGWSNAAVAFTAYSWLIDDGLWTKIGLTERAFTAMSLQERNKYGKMQSAAVVNYSYRGGAFVICRYYTDLDPEGRKFIPQWEGDDEVLILNPDDMLNSPFLTIIAQDKETQPQ